MAGSPVSQVAPDDVRGAPDDAAASRTAAGQITRDGLVAAATELITQGGYTSASVAAIVDRANVAAGTLYRHFPSKEALFVEVFRSVCGHELSAIGKAVAKRQTAAERLDAVVETFATRALRNPRLAWALLSEPIDSLVDAERIAYRRRYSDQLAGILREGIAAGEFSDQNPELAAAALVGAIGEALVGPISPVGGLAGNQAAGPAGGRDDCEDENHKLIVAELVAFCHRSVGLGATP